MDTLIRYHRMQGQRTKWILGTDHAGIATQAQVERRLDEEGTSREELGRDRFEQRVWEWRQEQRRHDHRAAQAAGRLVRLRRGTLHARRGLRQGRAAGVRGPVREGLHLPRPLHGQLGPGHRLGDLRPRGRAAGGQGHPLLHRLPAGLRLGRDHRGHGAARDDAGRHRDRRAPRGRALPAVDRRDGDPAPGRAQAADRGRRVRQARVRHRRVEDHPGPRPQRLRDRSPARPGPAAGDRRGRPHDQRGARALSGDDGGRGPGRGGGRARASRACWPAPSPTSTTCPSRSDPASGSSR